MNHWLLPAWSRICLRAHSVGSVCHSLYRPKVSWHGMMFARSYRKGGSKPLRTIQTLDSTRLSRSDFVDISNTIKVRIYDSGSHSKGETPRYVEVSFRTTGRNGQCFPADTRGFYYFVPAPHTAVQLASEVRFRVTTDDDPSSFAKGNDLLNPDLTPWRIPLVTLARVSRYLVLRTLLLRDGLTTPSTLDHCAALAHSIQPQGKIIHSLGQLFSLKFQDTTAMFHFATADSMHRICWRIAQVCQVKPSKVIVPYAGSALCSFEQLHSPKETGRILVMRVNKITSPVKALIPEYDGTVVKPEEGQLIMRRTSGGKLEPWSYNIDQRGSAAHLQGLFRG